MCSSGKNDVTERGLCYAALQQPFELQGLFLNLRHKKRKADACVFVRIDAKNDTQPWISTLWSNVAALVMVKLGGGRRGGGGGGGKVL